MPDFLCESCQSPRIEHVLLILDRHRGRGPQPAWRNRCVDCGAVDDFLPTRREILERTAEIRTWWENHQAKDKHGKVVFFDGGWKDSGDSGRFSPVRFLDFEDATAGEELAAA